MTNEEQRKVFANNLRYYINISEKRQKEVAKAIGEKPSTLNMWATGNSMPSVGKIQKLADYFGIGKSDLTDRHEDSGTEESFKDIISNIALYDKRFQQIIMSYYELPKDKKDTFCDFFEVFVK